QAPPLEVVEASAPDPVWLARLGAVADPARFRPRPLYLRGADARPQDGARIARR
ncbi:MAG: tRNA (adenosine(37)-N6)-threonylcarbamoyltransferase complex dimerization subunit type 1 TsaB, partial [Xanthobacteraceae bacterium]